MNNFIQQVHSISYYIFSRILVVTMWSMWCHRNQVTFDGVCLSSQAFVERVRCLQVAYQNAKIKVCRTDKFCFYRQVIKRGSAFSRSLLQLSISKSTNESQCLGVRETLRKAKLLGLQVYHPNQQQIGRGCAQTPALCTTRLTIFCLYGPQEILTETYLVAYQYLSLRRALTLDWTKFQSYVTQKEIFFYFNQSNFSLPVDSIFLFTTLLFFFFWVRHYSTLNFNTIHLLYFIIKKDIFFI